MARGLSRITPPPPAPLVGAALQVTVSGFELADLVNTVPGRVQLDRFQQRLRQEIAASLRQVYGISVREVGIERLSLPDTTLAATVSRMRSERETVAAERTAERTAEGLRQAAGIRAEAARDSRIERAPTRRPPPSRSCRAARPPTSRAAPTRSTRPST